MAVQRSQGKLRPRAPRHDELPALPETVETAPERDPCTGKFVAGNKAARRRKAKALAKVEITGLNPSACAPWLQPFAAHAATSAAATVASLPERVRTPVLVGLAIDLATADAVYRALLALGASGDPKALNEARGWLREVRQTVLTFEALKRDAMATGSQRDAFDGLTVIAETEVPK